MGVALQWLLTTTLLLVPALGQGTQTSIITLPPSTVVVVATTSTEFMQDMTTTVTPTTPASPQYTDINLLKTSVLNSTNFFRYEYNATFLAWNASLQDYADSYVSQCIWEHSRGAPGENLARGYPDIPSAVDAWASEAEMYNFGTPPTGFTEATGHFTQLVWKSTQTVGCGVYNCNGTNGIEGWYLVCEYWPPGNIVGQGNERNAWFEANVQDQINSGQGFDVSKATAGASGVGTSQATEGLPTASASSDGGISDRIVSGAVGWELETLAGFVALINVLGW